MKQAHFTKRLPLVKPILTLAAFGYSLILKGIQLLYQVKILKVHSLAVPVISVGNLTWGGTGKTPLVIHLAKTLTQKGWRVGVLTRGYGQDEARLLSEELSPIPVLIGADRVALGHRAVKEQGANLILLDDGFQQWRLKKSVEILMVDATQPFGNGHLIPKGSLREPVTEASRADLIVVSRSDLNRDGLQDLENRLRRLNPKAPIFFAHYRARCLIRWPNGESVPPAALTSKPLCTLAGIATPKQFEATVERLGAQIRLKVRAEDHHPYTTGELIHLLDRCRRHRIPRIVTTTKDAIRFPHSLVEAIGPDLKGMELLILHVDLTFQGDESKFLHRIDSLLAGPRG